MKAKNRAELRRIRAQVRRDDRRLAEQFAKAERGEYAYSRADEHAADIREIHADYLDTVLDILADEGVI